MPQVSLYNYSNNHEEVVIPVAVYRGDDLVSLTGGTDSAGVTYSVNHRTTGQGFKWIEISRHARCITSDEAERFIIDVFGSGNVSGVGKALRNFPDLTGGTYGKNSTSNEAPFFSAYYTEFVRNGEPWGKSYVDWYNSNSWTRNGDTEGRRDQGYVSGALFAYETSERTYFGSITTRATGGGGSDFLVSINFSTEIYEGNFVPVGADPGEKGFAPTNDVIHTPRGGGEVSHKKPGYTTDTIPFPGEPDETKASAVGSGFINAYDITEGNLANLGKVLYHPDFLAGIANFFINPLDGVVSLNVFPYTPHIGSSEYVKLLKYYCKSEYFGVDVTAAPLTKQFRTVQMGTVYIPEEWNSFLDYDATSASLYLPFIGEVSLDISEIMGGSVSIEYTIDFFTGMCVANVSCTRGFNLDEGFHVNSNAIHSYQGNCAVNIPLSATDYGSLVGSLIGAASAGLSTGIAGAVGSLVSSGVSGGFKPTVTTKGSIGANAGFCGVLYPYIIITRPVTAIPENYQTVHGFPSYVKNTLGEYQDLCICYDIDLSNINDATENELNEIRQLCREGVYV